MEIQASVVAADSSTLATMRKIPKLATRLAGVLDADILDSVARIAQGVAQFADRPVKDVEFEAFADAAEELGSDQPDGDFFARALPKPHWDSPWMSPIKRVVLVHRLREVVAQVGFTRFESLGADINGELTDELSLNVKAAPLARDVDWLSHLLAITEQHRSIWENLFSMPDLARVLDSSANIRQTPVTAAERLFVLLLILHLNATYQAIQSGVLRRPEELQRDIQTFFSLPIPKAVWGTAKQFQDDAFVRFVDASRHPHENR